MQEHCLDPAVFIRSMATRGHFGGVSRACRDVVDLLDAGGYRVIFIETVGVGQDEVEVVQIADLVLVVLPPGLDVTSILQAPESWIDGAARETGHPDHIEAVLMAFGDCLQNGRRRIRQGVLAHMTHSTYVDDRVKRIHETVPFLSFLCL